MKKPVVYFSNNLSYLNNTAKDALSNCSDQFIKASDKLSDKLNEIIKKFRKEIINVLPSYLDIDIFKESADEKARNNCMGIVKKKGKKGKLRKDWENNNSIWQGKRRFS